MASLLACSAVAPAVAAPDDSALPALRPLAIADVPMRSDAAIRVRPIALDLTTIAPDSPARSVVEFRLFDDAVFRATSQSVNVLEEGRWSWVGLLDDEPMGVVQFAVRDGVASGVIRSPERGVFRVRFTGQAGVYIAEEIDIANLEPCATGPLESIAAPGDNAAPIEPAETSLADERGFYISPVDLLVGYTSEARNLSGGTAGILAEIDLAVASTNLAYQNSEVDISLTLALAYQVSYNETGSAIADLSNWRTPGDGFMDDVHVMRDDIAADLCALIVGNFNACGIAYLMTSPSLAFEDRAFSVTELGCAVSNLSFAHELGHNLGCAHDRDNASNGAYSFSFGYRDPIGPADWRTIMAYAPGARIQHFSNPLVAYLGQLTGVLSGANAADNAKTLNLTRAYSEFWRDAATRRPIAFDLDSPSDGQTGLWGAETFDWEENGPVDSYSFVIATDPGLTNEVYRIDGLLANEHTIAPNILDSCATYYWGVEATLAGNSRQAATFSRSFSTRLGADLNLDGAVDTADLGGLLGAFGSALPFGDINGDGITDTADLGLVLGSFGLTCEP